MTAITGLLWAIFWTWRIRGYVADLHSFVRWTVREFERQRGYTRALADKLQLSEAEVRDAINREARAMDAPNIAGLKK